MVTKDRALEIGKRYLAKKDIEPFGSGMDFEVADIKETRFNGYDVPENVWVVKYPNPSCR